MPYDLILTIAAIVASYVTVIKRLKLMPNRYLPLVALAVAAVFVLVPDRVRGDLIVISAIGLSAAGVYELSRGKGDGVK